MFQFIITAFFLAGFAALIWRKILPERIKRPIKRAVLKAWIAVATWMLVKAGVL